jgi:CheY-like chemotaxis protein
VEAELGKRYGADYRVVVAGSAREALEALGELRDGQAQVSLVLAGLRLQDATGTELLARVREFYPAARRVPMFLESSLPGVFAVGDVRYGSVKRVASAVGEGSIAIRLVHDYLRGT